MGRVQFIAPFSFVITLLFTPSKSIKGTFYGLSSNPLSLQDRARLRWQSIEFRVHQKSVFDRFEITKFRPYCHPEFISGSYQNVVGTPYW